MKDIVGDYRERFRLQRKALRRYTALLLALAMITTLFVNWQLHSDGIAATAQYQCNQEEHTHTADCYTKVLVCGYEEGQPEDWNATFDDSASLDESIGVDAEDDGIALFSAEPEYIYVPHEHTDDCYQEVKTLTCLEEEHVHGDDCFDPEDGSLICEQFEHVHDDSCYTTDYELVCGLEDGELVEELNPAYTAVAAFEAPVAAKPVVVSPVIEAPIHYHTDDCYEEVLTCGLEEHHHTVNCLADPLADVEDESEWLAKTSTSLSGDWSADLLTVAQSQLGYTQSEKNFEVDADDGQTVRHYTRYGEWYGNPYGEWDVMFLSYCLNYAGIPQSAIPQRAGVLALRSDLRGAGYLMDPQSIPAAQQDAIALCDEGLPEEESFADADADDLGFADSASSFCSIQPGDIVFYNTMVTETVAVDDTPAVVEDDSPDADIALLSLDPVETEPQTEQRTVTYETVGIVSDVDEDAGTLSVISGNVDGKVDSVQVNISQLTGLISLAAVQEEESFRAAEDPVELYTMTPGGTITGVTVTVNKKDVTGTPFDMTAGDTLTLDYSYSIPAGTIKKNGNHTLTYHLPDGIYLSTPVTDRAILQNDKPVGTLSVTKDGEVTLVFNDSFDVSQPFDGTFGFEAKVTTDTIGDGGKIEFPGGTVITVYDKTNLSLSKKANGFEEKNGKVYAKYTVTVSSKNGWKDSITIHDELDNSNAASGLNGKYVSDSFVLKGPDGELKKYNLTIDGAGSSFEIKDLPELAAGQKYTLTYEVEITNKSTDGSGKFYNTAWVQEDDKHETPATHSKYIEKSSQYDSEDGYIYWTVTVYNPDGGDLNNTTLTDTIQTNGATIVGDITVTAKSKTSDTGTLFDTVSSANGANTFTYTFSKTAIDKLYTFTYKTTVPEGQTSVENHAEVKRGDDTYSADDTCKVTKRDWSFTKTAPDSLTETGTDDLYTGKWSVSTPVPAEWNSYTFTDTIKKPQTGDHYGIADELDKEIRKNLRFTCTDNTVLTATEANIDVQITYYTSEGAKSGTEITLPNSTAHVQSFKIKLTNNYSGEPPIKSLSIDGYHTYINVSGISEGDAVDFINKAGGKDAKYTYTKTKPTPTLSKGVSTSDLGSKKIGNYDDSLTTDYNREKDNYIYYQLTLKVEDWASFSANSSVTVTDTPDSRVVPDNTNNKSFYAVFKTGDTKVTQKLSNYNLSDNFSWSVDDGKITFSLANLKNLSAEDAANVQAILIRYRVRVNDSAWTDDPNKETETYTNAAAWGENTAHADATFTAPVLNKTGTKNDGHGDRRASYSIVINPAAKKLSTTGTVTMTDTMTVNTAGITAHLDRSTVKLYSYPKQDGDTPLPDNYYGLSLRSYTDKNNKNVYEMTLTFPDEQAFVLEYDYVTDASNDKVTLENTAHIDGYEDSKKETKLDAVNGWGGITQNLLTLYKVDSANQNLGLPGAVFTLYKFDSTTGKWDNGTELPKTGEDGSLGLYVGEKNNVTINTSTLYKLKETDPPSGYRKSDKEYFFIWTDNDSQTAEDAYKKAVGNNTISVPAQTEVSIYKYHTSPELYVPNERSQLTIQKFWRDQDGKMITNSSDIPVDSITVNLYRYQTGHTKAERDTSFAQTITLNKDNNWTAVYSDVTNGYSYYIEEPENSKYTATYSESNTLGVTGGGLLTVTNKLTPAGGYELPSTGGAGTTLYTAVGGTMVLAALVCGFCQKRRRERRAD